MCGMCGQNALRSTWALVHKNYYNSSLTTLVPTAYTTMVGDRFSRWEYHKAAEA